jgi:hypothetical protein
MAYNSILERQRAAFLLQLIADPTAPNKGHLDLMDQHLLSLGFTQPTLKEKLAAWAIANGVAIALAEEVVGL